MSQILNHDQFRKTGINSIFLGNFSSEEKLDDYLSKTLLIDFGFKIYPPNGPEMYVSSDKHCPLTELFKDFSEADKFSDSTVKALAKIGWHRASTAVIFYNLNMSLNSIKNSIASAY